LFTLAAALFSALAAALFTLAAALLSALAAALSLAALLSALAAALFTFVTAPTLHLWIVCHRVCFLS
jgi:hypothetical protein